MTLVSRWLPVRVLARPLVAFLAALSLVVVVPLASAQETDDEIAVQRREPRFGARGQWVVTGASDLGLSSTSFDASSATQFFATFSPGLDYFFVRNVSAGIDVNVSYGDSKGYGADGSLVETVSTTLSVGPRIGLNIPLGSHLSWYLRGTVGYESVHREQRLVAGNSLSIPGSPLGYPSTTQYGPWVKLYVPLLVHVAPHFFIGAGPYVFRDFGSPQGGPDVGGQRTTLGAFFIAGGTWSGEIPSAESPRLTNEPLESRQSQFGLNRQIVLDSEIVGQVFWTSYSGTNSSATSATLAPSVDYFVGDHVSIGVAAFVSYARFTGIDASSGATVTSESSGRGFSPRIGFVAPCGHWVSWYPRMGLVFGGDDYDEISGSSENKTSSSIVAFNAYAPFLVHMAPHVFVGFGPSANIDLSRAVSFPLGASRQNRAITLGAGLVVGGWL